jgi:anaerobic selenocysteine-containing dehydrogenase
VPVWRSMYAGMQPGDPVDPVPDYIPPYESPDSNPVLAGRYPLSMVSPKPHAFLNTQYGNEPAKRQRQGEQSLLIHPADATARQIETGSYVRVFNDRGSFEARAEMSEDVMPGLVMANVGYWPSLNRSGTSVNVTSADKHCELGQAGTYNDNLVEVARVA